ncbi:MAG: hypothetical protein N5P05_003209 [Chroococcopsis gigantea SAG 12.99]|nr:hypothetical protein [Chroococcopsis gigantea SAG 12.99]
MNAGIIYLDLPPAPAPLVEAEILPPPDILTDVGEVMVILPLRRWY